MARSIKKIVTIQLSADLHGRVSAFMQDTGISMGQVARKGIELMKSTKPLRADPDEGKERAVKTTVLLDDVHMNLLNKWSGGRRVLDKGSLVRRALAEYLDEYEEKLKQLTI